jgi:hypothetical protein
MVFVSVAGWGYPVVRSVTFTSGTADKPVSGKAIDGALVFADS